MHKESDHTAVTVITIVCTWDAVSSFACGVGLPDDDAMILADVQTYLWHVGAGRPATPHLLRAWDRFYRQYDPLVRQMVAMCCRRTACTAEHEDFVQEVWAEIVAKLPGLTYRPERGRLSSWLAVLTRRRVARLARRLACSSARHSSMIESSEALLPSPDMGPEDLCLARELCDQMDVALGKLREQTTSTNFELFFRRFRWGQSASEIGEALDLTPDEVRYRHYRLTQKWRKLTKGMFFSELVADQDEPCSGRDISRIPR
jgi:RNA polymerase sigma factor (sigma-70 family)